MRTSPARVWWQILGWTLIAIAVLGLIPPVVDAFHGLTFHLEGGENALHWVLGAATLAVAYTLKDEHLLGTISIWYGVVYLLLGVIGFFVNDLAFWHVGAADNLLHLAIGAATVWAGVASRNPTERASTV